MRKCYYLTYEVKFHTDCKTKYRNKMYKWLKIKYWRLYYDTVEENNFLNKT